MKQKHENITLSFPTDLTALLHIKISRRGISKYVAEAVKKALKEDQERELLKLETAYEEANKDPDRLEVMEDWKILDNVDDTEGWEWKDE